MLSTEVFPERTGLLVQSRLSEIEQEQGFRILFACESGSRAWGFASPDSDFDIRFVYVHRRDWYLSVDEGRDVFETPIEDRPEGLLDFGGWDFRKMLRLVKKSNPVIWEWLQSPLMYRPLEDSDLKAIRSAIDPFFAPISACNHYRAICKGTMDRELAGQQVKIKKYFYMLRPILAAMWVERLNTIPPMEFKPLLAMLDGSPDIADAVAELLERKKQTDERVPVDRIALIDNFLEREIGRLKDESLLLPRGDGSPAELDGLFRSILLNQPT